ncbi:MAG TPA: putative Ig domain-containing protein, partial [Pseudohaliea sp.]|nr:putative Ig domain-containing protein [Pseudohaliea sp.]
EPAPEPDPAPAPANNPPTISGTPGTAAEAGTAWSFTPAASDADGDALSFSVSNKPAWLSFDAATGRLYGTPAAGDVGTHLQILISVSDGQDSASLPAFDLVVSEPPPVTGFAKVSWTPPTEREDGSALETIDHYTVYYGQDSANLDTVVTVDGSLTSHQLDDLGEGTWYFAVTATCAGGLESAKSAVASKTIG